MHQPDPFSTILAIHSSVGVSSLRSDAERACTIYDHVTKGKSLAAPIAVHAICDTTVHQLVSVKKTLVG